MKTYLYAVDIENGLRFGPYGSRKWAIHYMHEDRNGPTHALARMPVCLGAGGDREGQAMGAAVNHERIKGGEWRWDIGMSDARREKRAAQIRKWEFDFKARDCERWKARKAATA